MRLLLDECLPRRLARQLGGHTARTAPEMGWAGMPDSRLLPLAAREFEVFITVDRNLAFQQNLTNLNIRVLVLHAQSNRFEDLAPLVPAILAALAGPAAEQVQHIGG